MLENLMRFKDPMMSESVMISLVKRDCPVKMHTSSSSRSSLRVKTRMQLRRGDLLVISR